MDNSRLTLRTAVTSLARWTAVAGLSALTASCGLQRSPAHTNGAAGTGPVSVVPQCRMADMNVRLDLHAAGVAAGTSYIPLDFTNLSSGTCRLSGFPVVTLATGGTGKQVGTAAVDARDETARITELRAGQAAHIWLRVASVASLPATTCRPVTAAGLRVTLPGQRQSVYLSHRLTVCAHRVPGTAVLTVEPFHPGRARPGTAQ
jgi:hypothetical protein